MTRMHGNAGIPKSMGFLLLSCIFERMPFSPAGEGHPVDGRGSGHGKPAGELLTLACLVHQSMVRDLLIRVQVSATGMLVLWPLPLNGLQADIVI